MNNTLEMILRAEEAARRGSPVRVFDWARAAELIVQHRPTTAGAGLRGDWGWTGGEIWTDGKINLDSYTYLASTHAEPEITLDDGEPIACGRLAEGSDWDSGTKWPPEALAILAAAGLV